ncbi:hypothetical protein ABFV05_000777 [Capra hircus]
MGKELERSASCHQQEMRFYEKRAQGSRVLAVAVQRKPKELRQEQDHNRQMLAKVESNFQPFPRGSCTPAAPPRAHRGPELPGEPPGHEAPQEGEGPHPEGSEISGYLQGGLSSQQPEEQQATATHPSGGEQRREELPGRITSLHTEEASLRCEISQLDSEIQQSLPDLHDSHGMQLHRRLLKKEARCLQSKKLLIMCKELNSVCQIRNLSKKRAGDLSEELKTTAACHRQEVCLCEERAQESWVVAVRMERALSELTRENARLRQLLAQVEFNSQLSPGAFMFLLLHPQPTGAHRGPQGSGEPLGHEAPPARGRVQP